MQPGGCKGVGRGKHEKWRSRRWEIKSSPLAVAGKGEKNGSMGGTEMNVRRGLGLIISSST